MKGLNTFISSLLFLIVVGLIGTVLLVHFDIIEDPIHLIKGNEIKQIIFTTKDIEMRKSEVIHLETINENDESLIYTSSDSTIVEVNEITGYVKALNPGIATITVQLKNHKDYKDTCTITVIEPDKGIEAVSISLSNTTVNLNVGESKTLYYKVSPSNASVKKITWSTSNPKVVTVDKYGVIKAVGVGEATIKIKADNDKIATCVVTVTKKSSNPPKTVNKYTLTYNPNGGNVSPTSKILNSGDKYGELPTPTRNDYTFNGWYTDASDGIQVSANTTINANTTIYAHWTKNNSGTPVTGVTLNKTSILMIPQNAKESESTYKKTLTATISPNNATNKEVTWSSSNPNIVSVDNNGVLLAKKAGTATITVTTKDGNKTAKAKVKVVSNELTNIYDITPTLVCAITRNVNNDIRAMQGVYFYTSDGTTYALYAGYQGDDKPTTMTLVNLNKCSVVAKNNKQSYGHANDIAMVNNKFYVVNSNKVYGVTVKNNSSIVLDEKYTKMNFSFSGFEYDKANKKFYSKIGNNLYTFPSFTTAKSNYKLISLVPNYYMNIENGNTKIVNQGLAYGNGNIYIPRTISTSSSKYYNHSYIMVYDASTGEYKYTIHYSGNYLCHLEGMTVIGDSMYLGMNCHQAKPTNQTFLVYKGISALEQKYQNSKK